MNRINDKTKEIEKYLEEFYNIIPGTFEEYKKDFKTKAACERYFEKIIEAVIDLSFLIIKQNSLKIPEEDKQAFDILEEKKIISKELAEKLKDAKGMRNILAHEYGSIDDEIVYNSIKEDLEKDIKLFLKNVLSNND